jgi:hypothetical protein
MKAAVGVVLDAGVFISLERRNRVLVALVNRFIKTEAQLVKHRSRICSSTPSLHHSTTRSLGPWGASWEQAELQTQLMRTWCCSRGSAVGQS